MTYVIIALIAAVALLPLSALIGEVAFRLRMKTKDKEK